MQPCLARATPRRFTCWLAGGLLALAACGASRPPASGPASQGGQGGADGAAGGAGVEGAAGGEPNVVLAAGNVQVFGQGFVAAEGKTVRAVVVTRLGRVIGGATGGVADGNFALQLPVKVADAYQSQLMYYVDGNASGRCNVTDLAGNAVVPASGVVQLAPVGTSASGCAAFGDYDLALVGQNLGKDSAVVAVADLGDGSYVAGPITLPIVDGRFVTTVPNLLITGHTYVVRCYVPSGGTGACRAPGWSKATPVVQQGLQLTLQASDADNNVCASFPAAP